MFQARGANVRLAFGPEPKANTAEHGTSQLKAPWPESASELYRPSYRRLYAKLVPTFADRRVPRGQRDGSLRPYSQISRPEPLLFLTTSSLMY
jgi:hypothetical protein